MSPLSGSGAGSAARAAVAKTNRRNERRIMAD
jgi:hypothetical protein